MKKLIYSMDNIMLYENHSSSRYYPLHQTDYRGTHTWTFKPMAEEIMDMDEELTPVPK